MIYLNGLPVRPTIFPDNTSQVWKIPQELLVPGEPHTIKWDYEHEGEFIHVAQLKALLDTLSGATDLVMPYLPYARQDKEVSNNSTFALRVFADLINSLNFDRVTIVDPHSDVAQLIESVEFQYPIGMLMSVFDSTQTDIVCYPDQGALKKYSVLYPDVPYIYSEKIREQSTGAITYHFLVGDPSGKKVLIVDDICDGGATFIILAKLLLKAGATEVNLFVTHGLFTKGMKPLLESGIKRVFARNGIESEF